MKILKKLLVKVKYLTSPIVKIIKPDKYNKITENIWIGDKKSPFDENFLKDNNIKLIINVTRVVADTDIENITTYRIPIMDRNQKKYHDIMINKFDDVYNLIEKHSLNNDGILIHCVSGSQRSPTILALYLMKKYKITSKKAKKIIRSKRINALLLSKNFQPVLNHFDKIN